MKLIVTARPEFWKPAMDELGNPSFEELRDDIRRVDVERTFDRPPIFVRHVFPVLASVRVDPDAIADAVRDRIDREPAGVQVRTLPGTGVGRAELAAAVGERLGVEIDLQRAEVIVSVLASRDTADVGVSTPEQNLSAWAGGEHRFKRYDGQINRAEFKLLEAFDVFGIDPSSFGTALDLGAAPGGWSHVLVAAGCQVVAVDPASLDERLTAVRHVRSTIGEFMRSAPRERFDVIVNDMRMDARMSARAQVSVARLLASSGVAVMTLKIGRRAPLAEVRDAVRILEEAYEIRGVRQLFHNRNEVTAALRKR